MINNYDNKTCHNSLFVIEGLIMEKEEILKKSRKDNEYLDEREEQEVGNSFGFGGVIISILCIIFSVLKAVNGERFYEFCVIVFGYLAGISWYNYKITKKKKILIQAISNSFAVILGFIGFFLLG